MLTIFHWDPMLHLRIYFQLVHPSLEKIQRSSTIPSTVQSWETRGKSLLKGEHFLFGGKFHIVKKNICTFSIFFSIDCIYVYVCIYTYIRRYILNQRENSNEEFARFSHALNRTPPFLKPVCLILRKGWSLKKKKNKKKGTRMRR